MRSALGYDQISLYAGSYGTRAAYEYGSSSAPAPPAMPLLDSFDQAGDRALRALVKDCASHAACSKAFPDFDSQVQKVRRQANDAFHVLGLQFLQYSSATSRYLPLLVSEAAQGRRDALDRAILVARDRFIGQLSIGLHLAISCSEELTRATTGRGSALRAEYEAACRGWLRAEVAADTRNPAQLAAPALIVAGEWDPVTSPRWARAMADQFRKSQILVVPGEGHVFDGAMSQCIGTLTADFLDRREITDSCVTRHTRPAYALELP